MKFNKTITGSLALHAVLMSALLFQTGCKTLSVGWKESPSKKSDALTNAETPPMYLDEGSSAQREHSYSSGQFTSSDDYGWNNSGSGRRAPTRPSWDLVPEDTIAPPSCHSGTDPSWLEPTYASGAQYVVKKGDSLWAISKNQGVDLDSLMRANGLNKNSVLRIGQKLTVPGAGYSKASVTSMNSAPSKASGGRSYTIKKGDTLSSIARGFGVSVKDLQDANQLRGTTIFTGKALTIPGASTQRPQQSSAKATTTARFEPTSEKGFYRVQPGDNLSAIAKRYGVSVADLMTWNSIDDARKLRAGQTIRTTQQYQSTTQPSNEYFPSTATAKTSNDAPWEPSIQSDSLEADTLSMFEDDDLFGTDEETPLVSIAE